MPHPLNQDFKRETPDPAPHHLRTMFGVHCETEGFAQKPGEEALHVHCEANMDDPVTGTWTVSLVQRQQSPAGGSAIVVKSTSLQEGLPFGDALEMLARFERAQKDLGLPALYPRADHMGFNHFRAFGEREGYLFDIDGKPHARLNPHAIPEGFFFYDDDIARANRNVARLEADFSPAGPARKIPDTVFVFETFNRAAAKNEKLVQERALEILDRLSAQVEIAHDKLVEYCKKPDDAALVTQAENALDIADAAARQLKYYGIDPRQFETFILQCQVTCNIVHAQGLYGMMHAGARNYFRNEDQFKNRVTQAIDLYRKTGSDEAGVETLKDMVTSGQPPQVPKEINLFIANYKKTAAGCGPRRCSCSEKPEAVDYLFRREKSLP